MTVPTGPAQSGGNAGELARARDEVTEVRAELTRLRSQLAVARMGLDTAKASELVAVNEQLVLATLAAQRASEANIKALQELTEAAELDPLTGLPNSALMRARTVLALAAARKSQRKVALLLLNLTDFKLINDTLGHATGDAVLQLAAGSLLSSVRPIDTVSRHRGNEFVILLPDIEDMSDAVASAATLVTALGAPTLLNGRVLRLTANVGISMFPEDGSDADSLIDRAVAAMYRAKWRGLGSYAFQGEPATHERSLELRMLEALRQPLIEQETSIGEYERQHDQLQEANTQLLAAALSARELQGAAEQAQRRQSNFLGVVAHELRNPLTPISNAAAMLAAIPAGGPLLAKVQGIIERQVRNMSRLVEDLLDVSRVNAGKLRLKKERVEIIAFINGVVEACRPSMGTRLQRFEIHLPPPPVDVEADPVRLAQVLHNILDNASKYTPEHGEIHVSAGVHETTVTITVADNGIGIRAEAMGTIFEPFVQEQHATQFNGVGLGIGLTVVREVVEGHGGQVVASSAGVGLGSQFTITLPLLRD